MLLEFLVDETDESEKEKLIKMLTEASDNLLETLENLNEVVAISTNVNLEKKPVNLAKKVSNVQQNLAAFLKKNNAQILNEIPHNTLVKVVPAYLDSILMNFITNSVKYKSPDRDPIVKLSVEQQQDYTVLRISDNGLGIDLDKYGEKLYGMYKTFHDKPDARGIGLYITKNQIEAMKRVKLGKEPHLTSILMKKIRAISIIDDDPITVFGIKKMLSAIEASQNIITFANGKEAIDGIRAGMENGQGVPEVIFLDINMPIMDGWQFLEEFITLPLAERIRINIG